MIRMDTHQSFVRMNLAILGIQTPHVTDLQYRTTHTPGVAGKEEIPGKIDFKPKNSCCSLTLKRVYFLYQNGFP